MWSLSIWADSDADVAVEHGAQGSVFGGLTAFVELGHRTEGLQGLLFEVRNLRKDSIQVLLALLSVFLFNKSHAVAADSEPSEQESQSRWLEETLLSLLAILVHGVTD